MVLNYVAPWGTSWAMVLSHVTRLCLIYLNSNTILITFNILSHLINQWHLFIYSLFMSHMPYQILVIMFPYHTIVHIIGISSLSITMSSYAICHAGVTLNNMQVESISVYMFSHHVSLASYKCNMSFYCNSVYHNFTTS